MALPRQRRRLAAVAGVAAALTVAALPVADAGSLLGGATDAVEEAFAPQLVTVTADLAQRNVLANSGLDVTEHAGHDYVEVVLHTPADLDLLESLGLPFDVRIPDLLARRALNQRLDRQYALANADGSPLPSGRTGYRTLEDYNADMKALADENPGLVQLFKLPHQSLEGKDILGVEISTRLPRTSTTDVPVIAPSTDERPTFVLMGLHHAREWPSGELAMEFAIDLVQSYKAGDRVVGPLVDQVRTVVIPVVNADGFEKSINDGSVLDLNVINDSDPLEGTTSLATPNNAYKRKNCRVVDGQPAIPGACDVAKSPVGYGIGVDLNRNYGAFHGGPGAAAEPPDPTYHGPAGFSEPETQNVREVVSQRHVTMLISNHTFSNLVLRPNGLNPQTVGTDGVPVGNAPDEDALKALGAAMTAQNDYANIHGWELYDTTGTTEDWSYNATGGYGYTFEIGPDEFHPPFEKVVDEYFGTGDYLPEGFTGGGNRAAYVIALQAAADRSTHGLIQGKVPPGATLRLSRTGSTPTWEGSFTDRVDTTLRVGKTGVFTWHVNPSTRPLVASKQYRILAEEPTKSEVLEGSVPAPNEHVDVPWTAPLTADLVNVNLDWLVPDDLDLEVYKVEGDELTLVTSSGNIPGEKEFTTLVDVQQGAKYVYRVINYASVPGQPFTLTIDSFQAEAVTTTGLIEAWTLTCEIDGRVAGQAPVIIRRGQQVKVGGEVCRGGRR